MDCLRYEGDGESIITRSSFSFPRSTGEGWDGQSIIRSHPSPSPVARGKVGMGALVRTKSAFSFLLAPTPALPRKQGRVKDDCV